MVSSQSHRLSARTARSILDELTEVVTREGQATNSQAADLMTARIFGARIGDVLDNTVGLKEFSARVGYY